MFQQQCSVCGTSFEDNVDDNNNTIGDFNDNNVFNDEDSVGAAFSNDLKRHDNLCITSDLLLDCRSMSCIEEKSELSTEVICFNCEIDVQTTASVPNDAIEEEFINNEDDTMSEVTELVPFENVRDDIEMLVDVYLLINKLRSYLHSVLW